MGLRVITAQGTVLSSTGLAEEGIALAEPADQRRALGLAFAVCSAAVLMGQSFLRGKTCSYLLPTLPIHSVTRAAAPSNLPVCRKFHTTDHTNSGKINIRDPKQFLRNAYSVPTVTG